MTTDTQTAPKSATGVAGASGRPFLAGGRRWRLPIAYGSIATVALGIDLALILGSATFAEAIYHQVPDEFAGEYSHTLAAAIFVAILFVAAMRVQKLYSPTRLMVWDDQASRRAGRLVRSLPDPGVGRIQLGREPRPFARRRSPVLGERRRGASRPSGGMEVRAAARTGKRGAAGSHDRQPRVRGTRGARVHRGFDPPRLPRGGSFPDIRKRRGLRRRHRERHFSLPLLRYSRDYAVRRSGAHVECAVDRPSAQGLALACDAGSVRNARALVPPRSL